MANLDKLILGDRSDPRVELATLFATADGDALAAARSWARGVIDDADVQASDQLRVIKALRDADPRLSLKPATYLAKSIES